MFPGRQFFGPLCLVVGCLVSTAGCAKSAPGARSPGWSGSPVRGPQPMVVRVVQSYPHDRAAFTQGLLLFGGKLYESTGLPGRSSLRRVDLGSGMVEQKLAIPAPLFAEGLARVGGRLFQLTWQDGRALVWNLDGFRSQQEFAYQGEGWGLCFDGRRLVMSDGSDQLTWRDPQTFASLGQVHVQRASLPVTRLNELECVDGMVYANVWQDNHIARIDPRTGEVTGWIDASGLLTREEREGADVLNGIAYWPEHGHFLITGKLWPRLFEVEFVAAP